MPSSLSSELCCIRRDLGTITKALSDEGIELDEYLRGARTMQASLNDQIRCILCRVAGMEEALDLNGAASVTSAAHLSYRQRLCCIRSRIEAIDDVLSEGLGFWIDSINGNDANSGRTMAQAVQTPTRLMEVAPDITGKRVRFARGSVFTEQITLVGDDAVLMDYGDPELPLPYGDCRDVKSVWTKTGGQTNVWQVTISLPGNNKIQGNAWANTSMIPQVTSLALCDSTPNSIFVADWTAASTTLYVHAAGSVDPNGDGKTYRYSRREFALLVTGERGTLIGFWGLGNAHQDGSIKTIGEDWIYRNIRGSDGCRHAVYGQPGLIVEDSLFDRGRNDLEPPGSSNSIVCNKAAVVGKSWSTLRCVFDGSDGGFYTGPLQHGAVEADLFASVTHTDDTFINCFGCASVGAVSTEVIRPVFTNCTGGFSFGSPGNNLLIRDGTGTINQLTNPAAGGVITSQDNVLSIPLLGVGFYRCNTAATPLTLNVLRDHLTVVAGSGSTNQVIRHQNGPLNVTDIEVHPTICNAAHDMVVAGFTAGTTVYTGAGNQWPFGSRFQLNGVTYNTFAAWQGAGHDASSSLAPFPATVSSDNFNRADENLDVSAGWTLVGGTANQAAVRTNQLATIGTGTAYYRKAVMASPAHWIRFTVASAPVTNGPYVVLRAIDQNNWIGVRWTNTAWQVGRCIAGTLVVSVVGSSTVAPAPGQDVVLGMVGDLVWLYVDGRQIIVNGVMSAPTLAAAVGVGLLARATAINPFIDDFSCGLVA